MSKPRLQDVLETLRHQILQVVSPLLPIDTTADVEVAVGWPSPKVLGDMMSVNRAIITLFPTARTKDVTRFSTDISVIANTDGSMTAVQAVGRTNRDIQASVWAPTPNVRQILAEAIYSNIGTSVNRFLTLSEGTILTATRSASSWIDDAQSKFTTYIAHIVLTCEYDEVLESVATPIVTAQAQLTVGPISNLLHVP